MQAHIRLNWAKVSNCPEIHGRHVIEQRQINQELCPQTFNLPTKVPLGQAPLASWVGEGSSISPLTILDLVLD